MNSLFKYIIHILNGNKDILHTAARLQSQIKREKNRQGKNGIVMNIIFL